MTFGSVGRQPRGDIWLCRAKSVVSTRQKLARNSRTARRRQGAPHRGLGRSHLGESARGAASSALPVDAGPTACGIPEPAPPSRTGRTPRAARAPAIRAPKRLAATRVEGDSRRYAVVMATARRTARVELDERLVSRARAQARDDDDEIIEDALSRYLLERLLDNTQQRSNLGEEEATRLAVEELHAMRRERDAAA